MTFRTKCVNKHKMIELSKFLSQLVWRRPFPDVSPGLLEKLEEAVSRSGPSMLLGDVLIRPP